MLEKKQVKIKDFDESDFTFDLDFYDDNNLFIISESANNTSKYCTTEMYEEIGNFIKEEYELSTFIYIERYKNDNFLRIKNFETGEKSSVHTEYLTHNELKKLIS